MSRSLTRLAVVASHPIQYVAPLYQRLARRDDLVLKVFYTWHAGEAPVTDRGFGKLIAWDIPLTEGYDCERVPNTAVDPGAHHFLGLCNPTLIDRVAAWRPDAVVINGWAWLSHLQAIRAFHRRGIRTFFRGDSHLLDGTTAGPRWLLKQALLRRVYSWPTGFLVVGSANRAYYERFGVMPGRLHRCPHSIDVSRFAEPADVFEREAAEWRTQLGITPTRTVLLFAGKFERKKRPVELMRTVLERTNPDILLILVGNGELQGEIDAIAAREPTRFRVIPFQNQSRMPVVHRMGDLFVLPSAFGETWGLAANEALACGRPVVVSDRVGCATEVADHGCVRVFPWNDLAALGKIVGDLAKTRNDLLAMRTSAARRSWSFDLAVTEATLIAAVGSASGQ